MLELPPIEERYHYITLSQEERNRYDKTAADMSNWINHKTGLRADQRDHLVSSKSSSSFAWSATKGRSKSLSNDVAAETSC